MTRSQEWHTPAAAAFPAATGEPMLGNMSEILEVTTFRVAPGHTVGDFVAANADVNDYLRSRPGFRWRRIARSGDDAVVDIVAYDTLAQARAGAAGITGELADSPVHATIEHSTVVWQLTTVLQHVEELRRSAPGSA